MASMNNAPPDGVKILNLGVFMPINVLKVHHRWLHLSALASLALLTLAASTQAQTTFGVSGQASGSVSVSTQTQTQTQAQTQTQTPPPAPPVYPPAPAAPAITAPATCPPGTVLVTPAASALNTQSYNAGMQGGYMPPDPSLEWRRKEYELDIHLGVPIFLSNVRFDMPAYRDSVTREIIPVPINPGFGFDVRLAKDIGNGLSLGGEFAMQVNRIDDGAPGTATLGNGYLGFTARYSFLNPSAVVPFVGTGVGIGGWFVTFSGNGTSESTDSRASLIAHAVAGVAYELSQDFAIEAGLRFNATTSGDLFDRGFVWLTPFAGGAFYW